MKRSTFCLAAVASIFLWACGGDGTSDGEGSADVGLPGDVSGGTDVSLPPCIDSTECRGGEVCVEGSCREACSLADPCSGELGVCNPATGVCVDCLSATDCGASSRCVDQRCTFFCTATADCGAGQACDTTTGQCVAAECTDDSQCAGGEACRDGVCRSILEQICVPNETRCEGNTLLTCSRDGVQFNETPCGDGVCTQSDGGAECAEPLCAPNDIGCLDANTAYLCDRTGTIQEPLPCAEGQVCQEGTCRVQICEPAGVSCDGDTLLLCDETGTRQTTLACNDTPECQDTALRCACVDGECEPRVCEPDSVTCVGPGFRACAPDGLGFLAVQACDEGTQCVAGACVGATCSSGTQQCSGATLLTCNAGGTSYNETDCAADGGSCVVTGASTATCRARICEPRTARCSADSRSVVTCDDLGLTEATRPCPAGDYCNGGVCLDQVCTPGSRTCTAGDAYTCNALGSGYTLAQDCAFDETCTDGVCTFASSECTSSAQCPRPAAVCDGNTLVSYSGIGTCTRGSCDYSRVAARTDCGTRVCDAAAGACTTPSSGTSCTSDAQCRTLATSRGYTGNANSVQCDPIVGCYVIKSCGGDPAGLTAPTASDPFIAPCANGNPCNVDLDLFGGGSTGVACFGCTVGDASTCRSGERCRDPLFDILGTGPFCGAE